MKWYVVTSRVNGSISKYVFGSHEFEDTKTTNELESFTRKVIKHLNPDAKNIWMKAHRSDMISFSYDIGPVNTISGGLGSSPQKAMEGFVEASPGGRESFKYFGSEEYAGEFDPSDDPYAESVDGEWGLRWREFDKNDRLVIRQKFFSSKQARDKFAERIEQSSNFAEFYAWLDKKEESMIHRAWADAALKDLMEGIDDKNLLSKQTAKDTGTSDNAIEQPRTNEERKDTTQEQEFNDDIIISETVEGDLGDDKLIEEAVQETDAEDFLPPATVQDLKRYLKNNINYLKRGDSMSLMNTEVKITQVEKKYHSHGQESNFIAYIHGIVIYDNKVLDRVDKARFIAIYDSYQDYLKLSFTKDSTEEVVSNNKKEVKEIKRAKCTIKGCKNLAADDGKYCPKHQAEYDKKHGIKQKKREAKEMKESSVMYTPMFRIRDIDKAIDVITDFLDYDSVESFTEETGLHADELVGYWVPEEDHRPIPYEDIPEPAVPMLLKPILIFVNKRLFPEEAIGYRYGDKAWLDSEMLEELF